MHERPGAGVREFPILAAVRRAGGLLAQCPPVPPKPAAPVTAGADSQQVAPAPSPEPEHPAPATPAEKPVNRAHELSKVAYQRFLVEEFENAERAAREALESDPDNPLARTVVANCLAFCGVNQPSPPDLLLAREWSRQLLEHDSKNAFARNASGIAFIGAHDLQGAEREFSTAIGLDPTLSMSEANLGYVSLQLGKLEAAEKAYRAAIDSRPDAAVPYNGLAQVLLARGENSGAIKASRAAISRYELQDTNLAKFYVNLAVALYQDGKRDQAIGAIARARALGLEQNPAYEAIEKPAKAGRKNSR